MQGKVYLARLTGASSLMLILLVILTGLQAGAQNSVVLSVELTEWYSCPFIFTWDGAAYQLENDIYSVGRGEDREYTDYLFLNNALVPKNGVYSFEIREVPSEQSWTDMLKLITIDHPAGVSVGVDSSGNVHSYANPLPPDFAYDANNNDVWSSISMRDDNGVDMYHNDAVVLDFSSVDITEGAKLVIDVDGFEGDPSGDLTGEVPAIEIQTLEAGSWVTRYSFFPKEFWAKGVFDLQSYLGESKAVRLLSVSCDEGKYHLIDYVGLDNTADVLSYSELAPTTAILNGNTDVLSDLSGSDEIYAYTEGNDSIVVTFPFIPLADEERSFVFVSEGYYTPGYGNTYYVDTWDGSLWVERTILYQGIDQWGSLPDTTVTADLSAYLPDSEGEYKIRLRNVMNATWNEAYVDWVSMSINSIDYGPYYAQEYDTTDILSQVIASDDVKWYAVNKWAVFKFNEPPLAEPGGPYSGDEGSPVAFDGSGSSDPDLDPLTYDWDWGDGTSSLDAGPTPSHTYDDNGEYQACLTVTDPGGLSDTQCTGNNVVVNGGFETGDFTGWITQDLAGPYIPLHVGGVEDLWFFVSAPTEGSFAALHGFDGTMGFIRVAQDVVLPAGTTLLEFDYRAGWDISGIEDRLFQVNIEPAGGGAPLQTSTILVAAAGTNMPDTGDLPGSVDVSSFAGSGVRISFDWAIPEDFTGPAAFQLDNVRILGGGVTIQNVAPTATFNAPTEANADGDFDLSLTSPTDPSSADTTAGFEYAFDCGDGMFSGWSGVSSVTCPTPDTGFTVRGKIRDKDGGETEYSAEVLVNYPPVAEPGGPYSGDEGSPVAFDGSGSSDPDLDPLTYDWDWGDGTSSLDAGSILSHIYDDNGLYKICLTVTDPLGLSDTQCAVGNFESGDLAGWDVSGTAAAVTSHEGVDGLGLVSLGREPPPPNVISPASTYTPMAGTYFALLTTGCPEEPTTLARTFQATAGDTISGWAFFDAGDAMPFDDNAQVTIKEGNSVLDTVFSASVATVGNYGETPWTYWEYTFAAAGTYTLEASAVNFRDCDADSYLGFDMSGVNIQNVAPTATFNAPTEANAGGDFDLSLTSPTDPSSADTTAGFEYAFDCDDGYSGWSGSNTTTCPTPDDTGLTVRGKIRDKDGGETEYSAEVLVYPTAKFSATPIVGTPPLTVTFTDESMGDPSSWAWNFGDDGTSTDQHPSHTYITTGTFTVTLTVSNTVGSDTMTDTNCVTVADQLPEPPTYPVYLPAVIKNGE